MWLQRYTSGRRLELWMIVCSWKVCDGVSAYVHVRASDKRLREPAAARETAASGEGPRAPLDCQKKHAPGPVS